LSELLKRSLVAVVGIPLAIFIVVFGKELLLIAVLIISSMTLHEYLRIGKSKKAKPNHFLAIIMNLVFIISFYYFHTTNPDIYLLLFFEIAMFSFLVFGSELWLNKQNAVINTALTISGFFYITLAFALMIGIRESSTMSLLNPGSFFENSESMAIAINGYKTSGWILMSIFFAVWICDSAAYFIGKLLGKHKLFPRVSPKKTWEGAIAGFFGGIGGFVLSTTIFIPEFPTSHAIAIGAIIGSIGQLGDLAESQLKRDAGVKDSSNLIPGHGGLLDRFDSIIFVIPPIYFYLLYVL